MGTIISYIFDSCFPCLKTSVEHEIAIALGRCNTCKKNYKEGNEERDEDDESIK